MTTGLRKKTEVPSRQASTAYECFAKLTLLLGPVSSYVSGCEATHADGTGLVLSFRIVLPNIGGGWPTSILFVSPCFVFSGPRPKVVGKTKLRSASESKFINIISETTRRCCFSHRAPSNETTPFSEQRGQTRGRRNETGEDVSTPKEEKNL